MARQLPSLNALKAFEASARLASFTLAAEELRVSHAAISRHIRDLEAWLGVRLFVRTGRGVTLTETGDTYVEKLTPLFDDLLAATEAARAAGRSLRLSVSTEIAFAATWLVPRLGRFAALNPNIELDLDPTDRVVDLRKEDIDLAIRFGDGAWPGVISVPLVKLKIFPVCNPKLWASSGIREPDDLDRAVLLHQERRWWEDWLRFAGGSERKHRPGPMFKSHLAVDAAISGQGFAIADNVVAADALIEGKLVRPFKEKLDLGSFFIVRSKQHELCAATAAFQKWIKSEMALTQAELQPLMRGRYKGPARP